MYIHIGGDAVVNSKDIIAILNIDRKTPIASSTSHHSQQPSVVNVAAPHVAKSIVVTRDYMYYSPVSVQTLKRRLLTKERVLIHGVGDTDW